jgi:hypothetical protein
MIGSKIAARGDAWEAYFTYQINDALSLQARYTDISYDYTGSNGFFGNLSGTPVKIDDIKQGSQLWTASGGNNLTQQDIGSILAQNPTPAAGAVLQNIGMALQTQDQKAIGQVVQAGLMAPSVVDAAQDFRLYLRYRF